MPAFTFIVPMGLTPEDSHACCTPWSVFQDGSDAAIWTPTTTAQGVTSPPFEQTNRQWTLQAVPNAVPKRPEAAQARRAYAASNPQSHADYQTEGYTFFPRMESYLPYCPSQPRTTVVGQLEHRNVEESTAIRATKPYSFCNAASPINITPEPGTQQI